jgi:hypothetical protein
VPCFAILAAAIAAPRAWGEVVDVADNGFTVKVTVSVPVDSSKAYAALVEGIGKWWDPEHTYSGDASNLSIEAKPQGCFCEKLPGQGFVRHLTVINAMPGKLLRLEGGLGPLQGMAVSGIMTWTFKPAEKGTTVEMRYAAGGYNPPGFKDLAPGVDSVLRGQLERYRRFLAPEKP